LIKYRYILPFYNGFTHDERVATIPIQKQAATEGRFRFPTVCSICAFSDSAKYRTTGYVFAHLEDYRRPLECYPCCRRCHATLHARFRDPDPWLRLVIRYSANSVWIACLTLDPASQWRSFDVTYPHGAPPAPTHSTC